MKTRIIVKLNERFKVQNFINKTTKYKSDIDLIKGRRVVDAKSALSILAMDLSKPIIVEIHSDDKEEIKKFNEEMEEFRWVQ